MTREKLLLHMGTGLCLALAFGCGALPTSTPTPTPIQPTVAPVPPTPTADIPLELHIDDARRGLDGVASFRYVTSGEYREDGSVVLAHRVEGVYVRTNNAWHAEWTLSVPGSLNFEFVSIGEQQWVNVGQGGDVAWLPMSIARGLPDSEGIEQAARDSDPFAGWPNPATTSIEVGVLQPGPARTISGMSCHEYLFTSSEALEMGTANTQVRLCVTAEGIPLLIESSADMAGATLLVTQELSAFGDPTHVVAPPE